MSEKMTIYIHPTSRQDIQIQAHSFVSQVGFGELKELKYPLEKIPNSVNIIGVVGGDGSVRSVTEHILKDDITRNLLVFRGGSQNGFWRSLNRENVTTSVNDLFNMELESMPDFHPAQVTIEDGESQYLFNHVAEFGDQMFEINQMIENMRASHIPRTMRLFTVLTRYIFRKYNLGKSESLQVITTGGNMGLFRIFPNQSLYDQELTQLNLQYDASPMKLLSKLLTLAAYSIIEQSPPKEIFDIRKNMQFIIPNANKDHSFISLGGDVFPLPEKGDIYIRRSKKSIKAVAVTW